MISFGIAVLGTTSYGAELVVGTRQLLCFVGAEQGFQDASGLKYDCAIWSCVSLLPNIMPLSRVVGKEGFVLKRGAHHGRCSHSSTSTGLTDTVFPTTTCSGWILKGLRRLASILIVVISLSSRRDFMASTKRLISSKMDVEVGKDGCSGYHSIMAEGGEPGHAKRLPPD